PTLEQPELRPRSLAGNAGGDRRPGAGAEIGPRLDGVALPRLSHPARGQRPDTARRERQRRKREGIEGICSRRAFARIAPAIAIGVAVGRQPTRLVDHLPHIALLVPIVVDGGSELEGAAYKGGRQGW